MYKRSFEGFVRYLDWRHEDSKIIEIDQEVNTMAQFIAIIELLEVKLRMKSKITETEYTSRCKIRDIRRIELKLSVERKMKQIGNQSQSIRL